MSVIASSSSQISSPLSVYDCESDLGDFPFRMKNILDSLLGTPAANKIKQHLNRG